MILPVSVAEECLNANSASQIKVMLHLYRKGINSPVSDEILAEELKMTLDEVEDALDYWIGKGFVFEGSGKKENVKSEKAVSLELPAVEKKEEALPPVKKAVQATSVLSQNEEKKKRVETITVNPPTQTELVRRCKESGEIRELMTTTEEKIGSPLSFSMQSTLLMLHDDYGLPVEVIALAVEYAAKRKKINSRYLANLGRLWCENETDTVDKAIEYIENANTSEEYWSQFRDITGVTNPSPTKKQREFLELWIKTMNFSMEMIGVAYEEMAEHTGKFNFGYMNKILLNWQKNGIFTPADAAKAKQDRFEKSQKKKPAEKSDSEQTTSSDASYDIDSYTKKAFSNPLNILK